MAADTLPLANLVSYTSAWDDEYRTLVSQYGNGIKQVAGDGLNNVLRKGTIAWAPLTLTQYQTVMTALRAAGGYQYFLWTPPGDTQRKWLVTNANQKTGGPNVFGVSAQAEEFYTYP